jgi:hypothetical protein
MYSKEMPRYQFPEQASVHSTVGVMCASRARTEVSKQSFPLVFSQLGRANYDGRGLQYQDRAESALHL